MSHRCNTAQSTFNTCRIRSSRIAFSQHDLFGMMPCSWRRSLPMSWWTMWFDHLQVVPGSISLCFKCEVKYMEQENAWEWGYGICNIATIIISILCVCGWGSQGSNRWLYIRYEHSEFISNQSEYHISSINRCLYLQIIAAPQKVLKEIDTALEY